MPTLEVYQSLWAMERCAPGVSEPSLEDKIARVAEAGFHGLGLDLAMSDVPVTMAALPLLERRGLNCLFNGFPRSDDELRFMLDLSKDFGAPFLNVIGQLMPSRLDDMIAVARRWIDLADQAGHPLLFETHRHGLLNDLHPTLRILEAIPAMALCADLSHFVVDREFSLPVGPEAEAMIAEVLARSEAFQGRVSSNEQIHSRSASRSTSPESTSTCAGGARPSAPGAPAHRPTPRRPSSANSAPPRMRSPARTGRSSQTAGRRLWRSGTGSWRFGMGWRRRRRLPARPSVN